jgi:hypothetical protein
LVAWLRADRAIGALVGFPVAEEKAGFEGAVALPKFLVLFGEAVYLVA